MLNPSKKWSTRLHWLAFVGLQLVVMILLLELVLRIAKPYHGRLNSLLYSSAIRTRYDDIETTEELLRTSMQGFTPRRERCGFIINSRGFRTKEFTEKRAGVYRVVVIGDSFTFASGCVPWKYFWPVQLEQKLNEKFEQEIEVFALAAPGVGPSFELRLWELEGYRLRPDLVVVVFFAGNDFLDEEKTPAEVGGEGMLVRLSYTYRLLSNLLVLYRERARSGEKFQAIVHEDGVFETGGVESPGPSRSGKGRLSEEALSRMEWHRLQLFQDSSRFRFQGLLANVTTVVSRFYHEVRGKGTDFLVMIIPDQIQIDSEMRRQLLADHHISEDNFDLDLPQAGLATSLGGSGIPYLDLLPEFREQARHRRLYYEGNTHWNVEGNLLATDLLVEYLDQSLRGELDASSR